MRRTLCLGTLSVVFMMVLAAPAWAQTLTVTKTDSPDPVQVGQNLTYTITVSNTGPEIAEDVQLADPLPANTTFVSVNAGSGNTCTALAVGASSGTITCDLDDISAFGIELVQIVVRPTAAAGGVGFVENTATAQGTNSTPAADTEFTQVEPSGLTLTKDDTPDPVLVGETLLYILEVTNNTGAPQDVIVTDELPDEVDFISVESSRGDCQETSGVVTCEIDNLAPSETATVQIIVEPQEEGTIENTAQVFFLSDLFTPIAQTTERTLVEGDGDDSTNDDDNVGGDGTGGDNGGIPIFDIHGNPQTAEQDVWPSGDISQPTTVNNWGDYATQIVTPISEAETGSGLYLDQSQSFDQG